MTAEEKLLGSRYVDTHFHLDLYKNPESLAQTIDNGDVGGIAVTNAPFVFDACAALVRHNARIIPAIGFHPELAARYADQITIFQEKVKTTRFVGEVGLDYVTRNMSERARQRQVFEAILLACADRGDTFITIHSRRATSEVIAMIGEQFAGTPVLHWFSGSAADLERAHAAGAYFSINTAMLTSNRGRQLIKLMERDRVLTETDGPFVQVDGRAAVPTDTLSVVRELAAVWMIGEDEARKIIQKNLSTALNSAMNEF